VASIHLALVTHHRLVSSTRLPCAAGLRFATKYRALKGGQDQAGVNASLRTTQSAA